MSKKTSKGGGTVNKINSIDFHCDGVLIQACNDCLYLWIDGDTSKPADVEIEIRVLERIIKTHEEQCE